MRAATIGREPSRFPPAFTFSPITMPNASATSSAYTAWHVETAGDSYEVLETGDSGFVIATVSEEEDARLIASAPGLLDECKIQLENWQQLLSGQWDGSEKGIKAAMSALEEIISTATGA